MFSMKNVFKFILGIMMLGILGGFNPYPAVSIDDCDYKVSMVNSYMQPDQVIDQTQNFQMVSWVMVNYLVKPDNPGNTSLTNLDLTIEYNLIDQALAKTDKPDTFQFSIKIGESPNQYGNYNYGQNSLDYGAGESPGNFAFLSLGSEWVA